jgi:hypothetical protein
MKCTICKGTGKQKVSFVVWGSGKPAEISEQNCIGCDGTGNMTAHMKEVIDYERNMWCKCGKDYGVTFYKDGQHPEISKHHYRCKKCKKVVQIG